MEQKSVITCGLDMSLTSTGYCMLSSSNVNLKTIKTSSVNKSNFDNDLERMNYIVETVLSNINGVNLVCIEDYFVPTNKMQMGSAIKLVSLGTLMRMALYKLNIPFVVVSPSQIKKYATGKGNCQKNKILREVYKKWDIDAKDDNQADAYVLARIADGIIKKKLNIGDNIFFKYENEVISSCINERPKYCCNFLK